MCGIAGLFSRTDRPVDSGLIERMTALLVHRGPDGQDVWAGERIALGHTRLEIRGLGPEGAEPVASPCGSAVVVYNGEIYNDETIRRGLKRDHGATFKGRCDAQITAYDLMDEGKIVYDDSPPQIQYPYNAGQHVADISEREFRRKFIDIVATEIAHHFVPYEFEEDYGRDADVLEMPGR